MRSWVIGSGVDCDVVVDSALVSARHCQLTQTASGFLLDDLGSTNGTYVGGDRIASRTRVAPGDPITLGKTVSMPWPSEVVTFLRIGRTPDNDIVVEDPRVSGRHARLIVVAGGQTLVEDLGSSNGTFLNSADRKVTNPIVLSETDTLYFGTLAVPATRLLARLKELETVRPPPSARDAVAEPRPGPTAPRPAIGAREGNRWLLAALAQAPVFALMIVLILGRHAAKPNRATLGQGIASVAFALALAAIWLGGSIAVGELPAGRSLGEKHRVDSPRSFVLLASRLAVLISVCALACAVLLAIVYSGSELKGPRLELWCVLVLASLVGLCFGLVVASLIPNRTAAAAVLLACFVFMIALGGYIWPLPAKNVPIRMTAAAMPSRWAFEGLLLLESNQHAAPGTPEEPTPAPNRDLAEDFFPAGSERMGPTADVMALGSMLIGLAALAAFSGGLGRAVP